MISIRKILCPVDFSACSEHAVGYAVAFAQAYDSDLELIHVVQIIPAGLEPAAYGQVTKEMEELNASRLHELAERVKQQHVRVSEYVTVGAPFVEIVQRAREKDVDLIVMGTHGRSGLSHVLIGSCAERVVRKAHCPVLTVRHPEQGLVMP